MVLLDVFLRWFQWVQSVLLCCVSGHSGGSVLFKVVQMVFEVVSVASQKVVGVTLSHNAMLTVTWGR